MEKICKNCDYYDGIRSSSGWCERTEDFIWVDNDDTCKHWENEEQEEEEEEEWWIENSDWGESPENEDDEDFDSDEEEGNGV